MDNILKPEEETLDLLAAELGFILDEKDNQPKDASKKKGDERKFRQPAVQKPFSQLT